jgi:hypothetical protein
MHDVAERRRFDQQNARELGGLQRGAILLLCVVDLAIQFPNVITSIGAFPRVNML